MNNERELILSYLQGEIASLGPLPVLNMLNTRYLVFASNQEGVIRNPGALGNAWFVQATYPVNSPLGEIQALQSVDLALQ